MKKLLLNVALGLATVVGVQAQTIWSGPNMTFTKAANADWTLPANQDRITSNVWITRANSQGIFNIKTETTYTDNSSPSDTRWAFGTTANISSLTFNDWETTVGSSPKSAVNQNMVLHLVTDDIYIDFKFLSWGGGNGGGSGGSGGGAFSYERSTGTIGLNEVKAEEVVKAYPNPTTGLVQLDINTTENVKVYDLSGRELISTTLQPKQALDISGLRNGIYFLSVAGKSRIKLVKE